MGGSVIQPMRHAEEHRGALVLHVEQRLLAAVLRGAGHAGQQLVERLKLAGRLDVPVQDLVSADAATERPSICCVVDGDV